jgi:MoaA/NifB/PqqE/SkfB family radical SAM enzyme
VFGGGEPTLRADFRDVVRHAYRLFGKEGVGFCTNGTTVSVDDLLALEKYLSFMQISIDGPEAYHNQWRDPKKRSLITNPFQKSIAVVSEAVKHKNLRRILEVSSIVTKDNLDLLADFIKFLEELGLKNYSIHRAMPVGRMALHLDKVPDMHDYLKLLLTIARIRKVSSMHIHLHHSLESIYSALLIGKDIHQADLPMSSGRHSIGVDAKGNVYFDPWCFVVPFNKLVAGNLLERDVKLWEIMESKGSVIRLADEITKKKTRCKQCLVDCSGGMRLNAMAYYVCKLVGEIRIDVSESHLLAGLSQIDPACPLFED